MDDLEGERAKIRGDQNQVFQARDIVDSSVQIVHNSEASDTIIPTDMSYRLDTRLTTMQMRLGSLASFVLGALAFFSNFASLASFAGYTLPLASFAKAHSVIAPLGVVFLMLGMLLWFFSREIEDQGFLPIGRLKFRLNSRTGHIEIVELRGKCPKCGAPITYGTEKHTPGLFATCRRNPHQHKWLFDHTTI